MVYANLDEFSNQLVLGEVSAYLYIDHHKVFAEFSNFLGFGKHWL